MKVLGIRFCTVNSAAEELAGFLGSEGLGLPRRDLGGGTGADFPGAVFPAGEGSWIEMWREGPGMPAGVMLQIVVDDADAWANQARDNGLTPNGPMDAHGERIYFYEAPSGLAVSVQSKVDQ
ncbi:MAG: hypothetical protein AAF438_17425, partial [Pseudomonadota bacterium]